MCIAITALHIGAASKDLLCHLCTALAHAGNGAYMPHCPTASHLPHTACASGAPCRTVSQPWPGVRLEKSCVVKRCSTGMRSLPVSRMRGQWERSTRHTPLPTASTACRELP